MPLRADSWVTVTTLAIQGVEDDAIFAAGNFVPQFALQFLESAEITWTSADDSSTIHSAPLVFAALPPELRWPNPAEVALLRRRFLGEESRSNSESLVDISRLGT